MKALLLVLLGLFMFPAQALTPEEDAELQKIIEQNYDKAEEISKNTKLAKQYFQQGRFEEALPLARKNYESLTFLIGEKYSIVIPTISNLALTYMELGQFIEALPFNEKAYALSKKLQGEKHPDTLIKLSHLVVNHTYLENFTKALPLGEHAYALNKELFGEKHSNTLSSLNNLADIYRRLGRLTEALILQEQVILLAKEILGEKHPNTLTSLNNLAANYIGLLRFTEALPVSKKSYALHKEVLGEKHPDAIMSLSNLALAYIKLGRFEEALPINKQSYGLSKEILGEKHPTTLASLTNLAVTLAELNLLTEALPLNKQIYTLNEEIFGKKHTSTLQAISTLAVNYMRLKHFEEALPLNKQAYDSLREILGDKHPLIPTILNNLATNYMYTYDSKQAIKYLEMSLETMEALHNDPQLGTSDRSMMENNWRYIYFNLVNFYRIEVEMKKAFFIVERGKAQNLLEEMARKFAVHHAGLNDEEINQHEQLITSIGKLDEMIAKTDELEKRLNLRAEHTRLSQKLAELHRQLTNKYPKYRQINKVEIINAEKGKDSLPDNGLFVNYLVGEKNHLLVFVLDKEGELESYDLGQIPNLEQTIESYRQILAAGRILNLRQKGLYVYELEDGSFTIANTVPKKARKLGEEDEGLIGTYLSNKLLAPLSNSLAKKERWIVSPDGALALLPFETLPFNEKMVIEQHSVNYVQSLSVLNLLKQRQIAYQSQTNRQSLLAVGDARYEKTDVAQSTQSINPLEIKARLTRGESSPESLNKIIATQQRTWKNLPASEKELNSLESIFEKEQPVILRKEKASESHLLELNKQRALTQYRYLLFSTHGYFSPVHPALSGIVLDQLYTPAPTDGYINAAEWVGYDLRSDLMVLSACETGMGQTSGDGVLGLPYALYVAGNTNTLLTLWTILDDSTAEFMRRFFTRLQQGENHVDALTAVKREFLKEKAYQNPLHWAAFVLYGI